MSCDHDVSISESDSLMFEALIIPGVRRRIVTLSLLVTASVAAEEGGSTPTARTSMTVG